MFPIITIGQRVLRTDKYISRRLKSKSKSLYALTPKKQLRFCMKLIKHIGLYVIHIHIEREVCIVKLD